MVSAKTVLTGAAILGGAAAFFALGGAKGIGEKIGGAFGSFGSNLVSGFNFGLGGDQTNDSAGQQQQTLQGIVEQNQLMEQVKDVPDVKAPLPDLEKGRVTFAQFLKDQNLAGKINLSTGIFSNKFTNQPLDFTIGQGGVIKTGTQGIGQSTLAAQQALSQKFGIPTFDVKGNLSTFGGLSASLNR